MTTKMGFATVVAHRLRDVPGVDAAYLHIGPDRDTVYVVSVEHGVVDRGALLDIETALQDRFGAVELTVRAHQGRDPDSMFPKEWRLDLTHGASES